MDLILKIGTFPHNYSERFSKFNIKFLELFYKFIYFQEFQLQFISLLLLARGISKEKNYNVLFDYFTKFFDHEYSAYVKKYLLCQPFIILKFKSEIDNLIYRHCSIAYIGPTERTFEKRIHEHIRGHMSDEDITAYANHFVKWWHNFNTYVRTPYRMSQGDCLLKYFWEGIVINLSFLQLRFFFEISVTPVLMEVTKTFVFQMESIISHKNLDFLNGKLSNSLQKIPFRN